MNPEDSSAQIQANVGANDGGSLVPMLLLHGLVCVASVVTVVDYRAFKELESRDLGSAEIPTMGSLRGQDAVSGLEWSVRSDDLRFVVLFRIGAESRTLDFWKDVAARTRSTADAVEFVAVCAAPGGCGEEVSIDGLTTISSLDPYQMRALSVAESHGRALLYRGQLLKEAFQVGLSPVEVAAAVVALVGRESEV